MKPDSPAKQRRPWDRAITATAITAITTRMITTMAMIGPAAASVKIIRISEKKKSKRYLDTNRYQPNFYMYLLCSFRKKEEERRRKKIEGKLCFFFNQCKLKTCWYTNIKPELSSGYWTLHSIQSKLISNKKKTKNNKHKVKVSSKQKFKSWFCSIVKN